MSDDQQPELRDHSHAPGRLTIVRAKETCGACPSQWNAWTADGTRLFLHYRHGYGQIRRGSNDGPLIARFDTGDDGGVMSLGEFCRHAGIALDRGVLP